MTVIDLHEAETRLDELVARAEAGEEVVIARSGAPAVRLVPVDHPPVRRQLGWLVGLIEVPPDSALIGEDPDVLALFEGESSPMP